MRTLVLRCENAVEFLAALDVSNPYWRTGRFSDLIFRGQRDSTWRLTPNAFRMWPREYRPFIGRSVKVSSIEIQARAEYDAALEFAELADAVGLELPTDPGLIRAVAEPTTLSKYRNYWRDNWPTPDLFQLLAVAQHHGVGTRLLDFTYDPIVAAFFAAESVVMWIQNPKTTKHHIARTRLAVWAIDLRFFQYVWNFPSTKRSRLQLIRVPRASNPFLHAQQGVFLIDRESSTEWSIGKRALDLDSSIVTVVTDWNGRKGIWGGRFATETGRFVLPLVRIEVPCSEAKTILRLLSGRGVTKAHLMPSHDGVRLALELAAASGSSEAYPS